MEICVFVSFVTVASCECVALRFVLSCVSSSFMSLYLVNWRFKEANNQQVFPTILAICVSHQYVL